MLLNVLSYMHKKNVQAQSCLYIPVEKGNHCLGTIRKFKFFIVPSLSILMVGPPLEPNSFTSDSLRIFTRLFSWLLVPLLLISLVPFVVRISSRSSGFFEIKILNVSSPYGGLILIANP